MPNAAAAREISQEHLCALDTAVRAAQALQDLGCTGLRLIGHDRDIPLIQIDPPPPAARLIRTSYYGEERMRSIYTTCLSYYAGAVLIWVEQRPIPCGRLH